MVELLVALAALAIMAGMSWQAIDTLMRTQIQTKAASDDMVALQAGLTQWDADLNALTQTGHVSALDFDGRTLRITRRDSTAAFGHTRVVGWSLTNDGLASVWSRWASPPVNTRGELELAWNMAANIGLSRQPPAVAVLHADSFGLLYFRNNTWSNPLSTADQAGAQTAVAAALEAAARARSLAGTTAIGIASAPVAVASAPVQGANVGVVPDGVRLLLTLSAGQSMAGELRKDWARPQSSGVK